MNYAYYNQHHGTIFSVGASPEEALRELISCCGEDHIDPESDRFADSFKLFRVSGALADALVDDEDYKLKIVGDMLDAILPEPEGELIESANGREMSDDVRWRCNWTGTGYETWKLVESEERSSDNYWARSFDINEPEGMTERELRNAVEQEIAMASWRHDDAYKGE